MKKIAICCIAFIVILISFNITAFGAESDHYTTTFIKMLLPYALEAQAEHGIPASLFIAQSALETGWGESLCGEYNYFGYTVTKNGKSYFKQYNSMEESITDYVENFTRPLYDQVRLADNYRDACYAVKECGYAVDPYYPQKLISIIKEHKLNKYDVYKPLILASSRGDKGQRVVIVQEMLTKLGYSMGEYGVDGIYGEVTQNAVRMFQRDNNLVVSGEADMETMKMMAYLVNHMEMKEVF
jgi:hypothetical protein